MRTWRYLAGLEDDLEGFDEDLLEVVVVDEGDLVIVEVLEVLVLAEELHHLIVVAHFVLDQALLQLLVQL